MKFKSIAIIFVGLAPIVAIFISWIILRIQHIGMHGFLMCRVMGDDFACGLMDGVLVLLCIVGVAWGVIEAVTEIVKLRKDRP